MGGGTSTTTVQIPEPTQQELENIALFNAITQAQLEREGFTVTKVVSGEGEDQVTDFIIEETPEAAARRVRRQAESDIAETNLFNAVNKLTTGDFSVTDEQKAQINDIVGEAGFQTVIDELTVQFGSAETAVKAAVDRMVDVGRADIAQSSQEQRTRIGEQAAILGRSAADSTFQAQAQAFEQGALERLFREGTAQTASAVAGIRGQQAIAIGSIREQEALARLGLLQTAAQPLAAAGPGGQLVQLQNALSQQGFANQQSIAQNLQGAINTQSALRGVQTTTTQKSSPGVLDILGATIGLAAGGASAAFGGIGAFGK